MRKLAALLILAFLFNPALVRAETPVAEQEILTVEQATEAAVKYSRTIKTLSESTILHEAKTSDLRVRLNEASNNSAFIDAIVQQRQNEFTLESNKINTKIEERNLENSVIEGFSTILLAERAMALYEELLPLDAKNLEIVRTKVALGKSSLVELDAAELSYNNKLEERESKNEVIDNAYTTLNNLMNRPTTDRYQVVLEMEYQPLEYEEQIDLDFFIANAQAKSQTLISLRHDIQQLEYQMEYYTEYYSLRIWEEYDIDLGKTQRAVEDEERKLAQAITNEYDAILKLEKQYETYREDIKRLEKQYRIEQAKLSVGKTTELQLLKINQEIRHIEEEIIKLVHDHDIKVRKFHQYVQYV